MKSNGDANTMEKKLKDKNTDLFFDAILHLETIEECYDFIEDL